MCGPAALAIAGAAVSAGGQIYSGIMAANAANYRGDIAEQNKELAREAADDQIARGEEDQRQLGREVAQRVGSQTARMAANNVDITTGSAARTIEDTQMLGREDSEILAENTRRAVRGQQINAYNFEAEKRAARVEAKNAKISSYIGAASSIIGGATQFGQLKSRQG